MQQIKAIFENSFCMDHKCIHYFEDMCMLCLSETKQDIVPYNCEYIKKYGRGKSKDCKSFAMGCNLAYEIDFKDEV